MSFQKKLALVAALFLAVTHSFSQSYVTRKNASKKAREPFVEGLKLAQAGDHDRAAAAFQRAAKAEPTFIEAYFFEGAALAELKKWPEAEAAFEKGLAIDAAFDPRILTETGIVELEQKKFDEAAAHFEAATIASTASPATKKGAARRLKNARFAAEAVKNPVLFEPQPLGPHINSEADDFWPTPAVDGRSVIFGRRERGDENFFITEKIDSIWLPARPLDGLNSTENESTQALSPDGRLLIFTGCNRAADGLGSCDLYFSKKNSDGSWSKAKNLGPPVSSQNWDSQPSISGDGRTLFFASDRPGGQGSRDIWTTEKGKNGQWGAVKNLGRTINSGGREEAPFIAADGQTLYFMSDSLPGMGGFDLFCSKKQADGSWSPPRNLGFPINDAGHEGALTVALDGRTAFFATDRPGGRGRIDIWQFDLPEAVRAQPSSYVRARVRDSETRRGMAAQLEFFDLKSQKSWLAAPTDDDGAFLICLPVGGNFALNVAAKNYLFQSENFDLTSAAASFEKPFDIEILMQKKPATDSTASPEKPKSQPIVLKNVFFETNSADLKPESTTELMRLKKMLDDEPLLKIQINGHTDATGDEKANLELSEKRAAAVLQFLIEKGQIAPQRLRSRGFGETQPVASNDSPEGRATNRRTEFFAF